MSPDTRLGMTSSHLNHQRQRVVQRQCFTSQCLNIICQRTNVNARCLDVSTYQSSTCRHQRLVPKLILVDQSINNGCNVSLPRDTRNVVHKQMRVKELHAYKCMDKSSTDILWLTSELGFGTYKTSLMQNLEMACFAVFI